MRCVWACSQAPPACGGAKRPRGGSTRACGGISERLTGAGRGRAQAAKNPLTIARSDAAYYLWKLAAIGDRQRVEIGKAGCLSRLIDLLINGPAEGRYAALGVLATMVHLDDLREIVAGQHTGARNIAAIADLMLGGQHFRSQTLAAQVLVDLAAFPECVVKILAVIPQLTEACRRKEPVWAGAYQTATCAATTLYILGSVEELPETASRRAQNVNVRAQIIRAGALEPLCGMLGWGSAPVADAAVAALSCVVVEPGAAEAMVGLGAVPHLVRLLESPLDRSRAKAAKCLMCLAYSDAMLAEIIAAGAVPPLCAMLRPQVPVDPGKKKKKKKKKDALPPMLQEGVLYACGALRHVTFSAPARRPVVDAGVLPVFVEHLKSKDLDIFQHVTGILYNLSLEKSLRPFLEMFKTPGYLTNSLHERLLLADEGEEGGEGGGEGQGEGYRLGEARGETEGERGAPTPRGGA